MARIIDGKQIAADLRQALHGRVDALKKQGITPGLGVVLAGDNPASQMYVGRKEKACAAVGIYTTTTKLSADVTASDIRKAVQTYNDDPAIHGILVQLPLPNDIPERPIIEAIDPAKDVDGLHPQNLGNLLAGTPVFVPCTPAGCLEILKAEQIPTEGRHVVVVGRSNLVGKPIAALLAQKNARANATVTICHSRTVDLPAMTRQADILIAAIGSPEFITGKHLREGVVVIDVGMNRVDDATAKKGYRLTGDVDFASAEKIASAITPVPGGVGPLTIACLLQNTVLAAERTVESR